MLTHWMRSALRTTPSHERRPGLRDSPRPMVELGSASPLPETELREPIGAVRVEDDGNVAVLDRRGITLATIAATRAAVPGSGLVEGNYLAPGPHWQHLNAVLGLSPSDEYEIAGERLHWRFPGSADAELENAALEAIRRLRTERTRVFAHDVRVDVRGVSLTFKPLTVTSTEEAPWAPTRPAHLELPFLFKRGEDAFSGALRLQSLGELPACNWQQVSDAGTLAVAWSLALVTYAELTCLPVHVAERRARRRRGRRSARSRASTREASRLRSLPRGSPQAFPPGFRPQGETARHQASWVAGMCVSSRWVKNTVPSAPPMPLPSGSRYDRARHGSGPTLEVFRQMLSCFSDGRVRRGMKAGFDGAWASVAVFSTARFRDQAKPASR
jgi:hypothetical protein